MRILATLLILSSVSFATNGGNVIGVGARSLSMGGTGLAHNNGHLDAIYKNPALLTEKASASNFNMELAATYLGLNVTAASLAGSRENKTKGIFVPDFAASYRLDDQMALGLGFLPYGGADFNYENEVPMAGLKVQHKVIRIQPTFAMAPAPGFSFGLSPILLLGSLSLNSAASGTQSSYATSSGMGFGGQVGAAYTNQQFTVGASYILPSKVKHEGVTNVDLFGPSPTTNTEADTLELQQPGEIGVGIGYAVTPEWSMTFDYRNIMWGSANIYKDLGWVSQSVFAFGTQYKIDKLAIRAGFNYGKPPVEDVTGEVGTGTVSLDGRTMFVASASLLNAIGFPPAAKTHITLGGGYEFTDTVGVDLALVYAPKTTISRAGTAAAAYVYASEMSQFGVTAGLRVGL